MSDDNILLTGFMGTGKTTTGRALARRLGREFVDTDELLVARAGQSIADIFRASGENHFRALEAAAAEELAARRGLVIATGGRLLLDPDNATALGATGPIFCLTATPETILARVGADAGKRPLLSGADPAARIRVLLAQRAPAYARFRAVPTDGRGPGEVAAEIAAIVAGGLREVIPVRHPGGAKHLPIGFGDGGLIARD